MSKQKIAIGGTKTTNNKALNENFNELYNKVVTSLALNSSGHLILTFSDETTLDGGAISGGGGISKADLLSFIYPVGSIYTSVNLVSPSTFLGGTWVQLQDRFLLGAGNIYSNGATGGEATHLLTTSEMPSHTHTQNSHNHSQYSHGHSIATLDSGYSANITNFNSGAAKAFGGMENSGNVTYVTNAYKSGSKLIDSTTASNYAATATNQYTGGASSHNNMPPYLAVYMWKRTA